MLPTIHPTAFIRFKQYCLSLLTTTLLGLLSACGSESANTDTSQVNDPIAEQDVIVDDAAPTEPAPIEPTITEVPSTDPTQSDTDYDLSTRTGAQAYYTQTYLPTKISDGNDWNGNNINSCNAGILSESHKQKALARLNYYRSIVGSPETQNDNTMSSKAQRAAYVAQIQYDMGNSLSSSFHSPRDNAGNLLDWDCLNEDAAEAFSNGNIAQHPSSLDVVFSVSLFVWDPGANNASAGHRDGLFKSNLTHIGIGASREAAVIMMKNTGNSSGIWTWPPADIYVPSDVLSPFDLPRWSLRNEKAWILRASKTNNENITPSVDITDCNDASVAVSNIKIADNKLLTWEVDLDYSDILDECEFNVRISNYYTTEDEGDGAATGRLGTFKYKTTIFKASN